MKPTIPVDNSLPQINAIFSRLLIDYLRDNAGIDPAKFLSEVNIDNALFDSENELIPMSVFMMLMEEASKYINDPNLGLHYYQNIDIKQVGIFGYTISNSPDLKETMSRICRYYCLFQNGMEFKFFSNGHNYQVTYEVTAKSLPQSRQDSEMTLMALIMLVRNLIKPNWRPITVHFKHKAPKNITEHKQLLCNNIVFNQPVNAIIFDDEILELPIINADQQLGGSLITVLEQLLVLQESPENEWLTLFRNFIMDSLCEGPPSIDIMAKSMNMSRRTLQRKLANKGWSFKDLVENIRQELAKNHLRVSDLLIQDIAFLLGYSEISSFNRAFKRWEGKTPHEYRNDCRANATD